MRSEAGCSACAGLRNEAAALRAALFHTESRLVEAKKTLHLCAAAASELLRALGVEAR